MKHFIVCAILALFATHFAWTASQHHKFDQQESEQIQKTLVFSNQTQPFTIKVDNIFGSVEVNGTAGKDVRVSGKKTLSAASKADLEKARRDVRLDMSEHDNQIDLIVNGPFRRADGSVCWNDDMDYVAVYDLALQVPEKADLIIKTVNDGEITIRHVSGKLKISHVNGKITLEDIGGAAKVHTVNGKILATFKEDPKENCSFVTVNGEIKANFSARLTADFAVKTLNGGIYSDYDVTYMPAKAGEGKREKGMYVYRSNREQHIRVGAGGPEIDMETINGDIIIAQKSK